MANFPRKTVTIGSIVDVEVGGQYCDKSPQSPAILLRLSRGHVHQLTTVEANQIAIQLRNAVNYVSDFL